MDLSKGRPKIHIQALTKEQQDWFSLENQSEPIVKLKVKNYNFFPKRELVGIVKGKFSENSDLAIASGFVQSNSNLGSKSVLVKLSRLDIAISMLENNYCTVLNPMEYPATKEEQDEKYMVDIMTTIENKYEEADKVSI